MRNRKDSDRADPTPAEGVRILGADEAQSAASGERRAPMTRRPMTERPIAQGDVRRDDPMLDLNEPDRLEAERVDEARQLEAVRRFEAARRVVGFPDDGPSWAGSVAEDDDEQLEIDTDGDAPHPSAARPIVPRPSAQGPSVTRAPLAAEPPSGEIPPLPHWTEPPTGAVPAIFADDDDHEVHDDDLDAWATISGSQPRFRAEGSDWAEADFGDDLSGEHERLGALSEDGPVDEEAEFAEALAERRRIRPPKLRSSRAAAPEEASAGAAAPIERGPRPPRRRQPEPELAPPGPARARDLPTALLTAALIAIVSVASFKYATWTAVLASVIVGIAAVEFCNALHSKGFRPATLLVLTASASLPLAVKHYGAGAYPIYVVLIVVFSLLWFLWKVTPGRPLLGVATSVLAFAYIGGLGGFAGLLLARPSGVGLIVGVAICTIAYDVFGFFIGSQFGRTAIAPSISPNKSVQGTVAGMIASVVAGAFIVQAIGPWDFKHGLLLGFLVAIGAFFGDLCESMIKRDLGVKDFGTMLPGHGGVLDRFDGLLFCLPIAYYLAVTLKIH